MKVHSYGGEEVQEHIDRETERNREKQGIERVTKMKRKE